MNTFRFTVHFDSEESCRLHFKSERDKIGIKCRRCGHNKHYWIKSVWSYECKSCRARTSLRSGTIMQSSNLSFMTWYKSMFLMSTTKKGFSSKEIQKQLGLKRYEPVWAMVHKFRKAIGNQEARYTLEGMIEMDKGYFTVKPSKIKQLIRKRKYENLRKQYVLLLAESNPLENIEPKKKERQCRYFKATVRDAPKAQSVNDSITTSLNDPNIVFSAKNCSYVDISDFVELYITKTSDNEVLKWVHITISNTKRDLLGTLHKIKREYLQLYLNEFVNKFNKRYFDERLFDRLVIACITEL